jgi:ribosomal-protein-alanine N-acetyltransferase
MNILETHRLILRELVINDAADFFDLNLDPEVLKYTGDTAFDSIEDAEKFLRNYDHYSKYGFGRWAMIKKNNEEFLGWCGLKYTSDTEEYDIGYRLFKRNWNAGYATEAAKACLGIGFNRFGIKRIVGRAMKDNVSSIHVLEKLGFSFLRKMDFDRQQGVVYKIDKSESNSLLSNYLKY